MATEVFAPAKINLTLHVTGRRPDGYHLLDSLVAFADCGDRLRVCRAGATRFEIGGPMAAGLPADDGNLVLRAAGLMAAAGPMAIRLEKNLPVAAGLGGGSADAAATLLAIAGESGAPLPPAGAVAALGADVPACLAGRALRMSGIGERLAPLRLPPLHFVLVNPGVALPTARVFAALRQPDNPPMPPDLPDWPTPETFAGWLRGCRNDLEAPALALEPEIGRVLEALAQSGEALVVRMSGSGASCFALFASRARAERAAREIARRQPGWWVVAASGFTRSGEAAPLP